MSVKVLSRMWLLQGKNRIEWTSLNVEYSSRGTMNELAITRRSSLTSILGREMFDVDVCQEATCVVLLS